MRSKIKNWVFTTAVALFVATLVVATPIYASTVTSPSDSLSSEEVGVAANHSLFFTTSSGVTENKVITLTFSSDFNTASLTEDDIDLTDDGTNLTTAANCAGTEKASVSIASDIITITICAGDGGTITAGSIIGVKIGTNATTSGTGANQITNPATVGTYFVAIGGDFGDSGTIAIPIITDGSVGVTGTVSGSSPPGGGSPGPTPPESCTDVIAPTVSNVLASSITTTSATVSWTTDEAASGTLYYGLTSSYELGTLVNDSFSGSQSLAITGLTSGLTYHYKVTATDSCGNSTTSSDSTFTTIDVIAPVISNIQVSEITNTSARISWTTNELADSRVDYGTTTSFGLNLSSSNPTSSHLAELTSLTEEFSYYFKITASDASGNTSVSNVQIFKTIDLTPPSNISQFAAVAGDELINLTWVNPTDRDFSQVLILSCTDTYPSEPSGIDQICQRIYLGQGNSFTHTGLTNNRTYYYGAFAYDANSNFSSGALISATPVSEESAICGDGICQQTESTFVCPSDCLPPEEIPDEEPVNEENPNNETPNEDNNQTSDNGTGEETTNNETGTDELTCGNGICDLNETNKSCQSDCSSMEIPTTNVTEEEKISLADVSFFGDRTIQLTLTNNSFDTLTNSGLSVVVSEKNIIKEVKQVYLTLGSETYLLNYIDGAYRADVTTPGTSTRHALHVVIEYTDGTAQDLSFITNLLNPGLVFEKTSGQTINISGATVTLYNLQNNTSRSIVTTTSGAFAWYVENGNYKITAEKNGYQTSDSGTVTVNNNIFNSSIEIKLSTISVIQSATENVVKNVTETVQVLRESPVAQTTAQVATPAIIATSAASVAVMTTSLNLLPFLQLIFTSPLMLFKRRKRTAFGVVYQAFTKTPIDLATIRLYRSSDNKLVLSRVTDKGGRYFFMVQPGTYHIEVKKNGFVFPSQTLSSTKDDAIYLDVYHGEQITVTEKNTIITPNIPVEPTEAKKIKTPWQIKRSQLFRKLQKLLAATSIFVSLYVLIIYFSVWTLALFVVQVGIYLLVKRLATTAKPKSWGIVYDKTTNRPLSNVIVRLFEPKYHKLLETWITDKKGRYAFILGPNQYASTYEKTGYQPAEIQPIDLSQNKEVIPWAQDIKLEQKKSEPTNPASL